MVSRRPNDSPAHHPRSFHAHIPPQRRPPCPERSTPRQPPDPGAEELHYNQISLRAEVSQEVARDLMIVTLYTEEQNTDPAKLAADISTTMNKALGQATPGQGRHPAPGQPQQLPDLRHQGPEDHRLA